MSNGHTQRLFSSPLASISDVDCQAPRARAGPEREVGFHEMVFVRRGVFVTHLGRHDIVVDPAQVLCLNAGSIARFSHPMDHGDCYTALELPSNALLDVTMRRNPWLVERPDRPLPLTHAVATPAVLIRLQRLRLLLLSCGAEAEPLQVEDEILALVDAVMAAALDAEAMPRRLARRRETRRGLRDLAERTRLVLAADPGASGSLAEIANAVGVSPFHLARVFRQETGLPVHQYRLRLRLAMALDRLADGEENLSALGHELGFASHSHFTYTFRTAFGAPPASVRRRLSDERRRRLTQSPAGQRPPLPIRARA